MKYETKVVTGYWRDDVARSLTVRVALGKWDGVEDHEDAGIFYYMDGEPLTMESVINSREYHDLVIMEDFIVTDIEGVTL